MPAAPGVGAEFLAIAKSLKLTNRTVADKCGFDASLITLMTRDDWAPSYGKAAAITEAFIEFGAPPAVAWKFMAICGYWPTCFNDTAEPYWDACIEGALLTPYERRPVLNAMKRAIADVKATRAKGVPA